MQLASRMSVVTVLALVSLGAASASAQVVVNSTTTFYRESGGDLNQTTINPAVNIRGTVADRVTIRAGWEADIVSGASVAVVDAPAPEVDAVSSATQWNDFRNVVSGGLGVRSDYATLDATYRYGTESDYRSHGFTLSASTELFERNTTLAVSYGRGFDQVCNLAQPRAQEAVDRARLPGSDGCFESEERESLKLSIQTFQGSWTQAWAPVFATQFSVQAQVLDGYQGNPYRAVWLGRTAAQENHPNSRARYTASLGMRFWITPFNGALQLEARAYRDTWDVSSVTAELGYEQNLIEGMRLRARARYYNQTGAAFFSNDYARAPRGQYFTGDRELSPMSSWLFGGRFEFEVPTGDDGRVGIFGRFAVVLKFDWMKFDFREFAYGRVAVPNDRAIMTTLGLEAGF